MIDAGVSARVCAPGTPPRGAHLSAAAVLVTIIGMDEMLGCQALLDIERLSEWVVMSAKIVSAYCWNDCLSNSINYRLSSIGL